MKSRSLLLVVSVSLAATLCLAGTYCVAQYGQFGRPGQFRNDEGTSSGVFLIDDLPKVIPREVGRYQVITLGRHTLLLDTRSGETWVLTGDAKEDELLSWVEVPRLRIKQKAKIAEPGQNDKPKPLEEKDPF